MIYSEQVVCRALVDAGLGSDVEIYGMIGPNGGPYTVQVDGGSPATFNAKSAYLTPQTLLYRSNGLGPGPHEVRIANTPFSGQTLSIDYAVVWRPPSYVSPLVVRFRYLRELKVSIDIRRTGGDPIPQPPPSS